jgi:adenylate cyclase
MNDSEKRPRRVRRTSTIFWSLFRCLLLIVCALAITFLVAFDRSGAETTKNLSQRWTQKSADEVETVLDAFLAPIGQSVEMVGDWIESGVLRPADGHGTDELILAILKRRPQIDGVSIARAEGLDYFIRKDGDALYSRTIDRSLPKAEARIRQRNLATGELEEHSEVDPDYDATERTWFKAFSAVESKSEAVLWTEPYGFYTASGLGMSAGRKATAPSGETYIVAVDLLFDDLSLETCQLQPSEYGLAFVMDEKGGVVGLPRQDRFAGDRSARAVALGKSLDQVGVRPLASAHSVASIAASREEAVAFDDESGRWWLALRPYALGERRLLLGVALPESDFVAVIRAQWGTLLVITLIAVGVAVILAIDLSRSFSEPLDELVRQSERFRDLMLESGDDVNPSPFTEINVLTDAQERMRVTLDSFSRYVPTDLVRELVKRGEAARIGGSSRTLTILFTDIRDFTGIAETMPAARLTAHIGEYFEALLDVLTSEGATVDKFIGDSIMAFWGAPEADEDHATHAVAATIRCKRRVDELNKDWVARGLPPLPTRFGIATGEVIVGNVGASTRLAYTVLGDTVNLASRIEGLNKVYGTSILASEAVLGAATGDALVWRRVDRVTVKGKTQSVDLFEPLGYQGQIPAERLEFAALYEKALACYQSQRFEDAMEALKLLVKSNGRDLSVKRLMGSCREFLETPPPANWDGVAKFSMK